MIITLFNSKYVHSLDVVEWTYIQVSDKLQNFSVNLSPPLHSESVKTLLFKWKKIRTSWGWAGPSSATAGLSWSKVLIWLVDWLVLIQHCTLYHTSFYSSWLRLDGFWLFKSFLNFRWVEGRLNEMKAKHSPAKLCQVSIDLAILV